MDRVIDIYKKEYESLKKEVIMEIEELTDFMYFADYEIINQIPMKHTVLTTMPTDLISISVYDIMSILTPGEITLIKQNMKMYPTDFTVMSYHLKNMSWFKFKDSFIENIVHPIDSTLNKTKSPQCKGRSDTENQKYGNLLNNYIFPSALKKYSNKHMYMAKTKSVNYTGQKFPSLTMRNTDQTNHQKSPNFNKSYSMNNSHVPLAYNHFATSESPKINEKVHLHTNSYIKEFNQKKGSVHSNLLDSPENKFSVLYFKKQEFDRQEIIKSGQISPRAMDEARSAAIHRKSFYAIKMAEDFEKEDMNPDFNNKINISALKSNEKINQDFKPWEKLK